jgi:hypothetical protein
MRLGRPDEAVEHVNRELPDLEKADLWIWLPELHRILGDVMLAADSGAIDAVRQVHRRAAALADQQRVPMLGLRIALSQARLVARLNAFQEAADMVRSALKQIPERDDSADFLEAERFVAAMAEKVHPR